MIRQKTSNTFLEGLILDANPLTSSLKSLSNCLNGTFITNDGDEMILLNDMGNARVLGIKLDTGYVPVGMCVHGGVTYIASYNPVTNKGLVGSFPSPSELEYSKDSNTITPNVTLSADKPEYIQQIFPEGTIIRPGDKFRLITDSTYISKKLISHTFNTDENQISTYKNKAVTISICVADSNGTLHDITRYITKYNDVGEPLTFNDNEDILLNLGTPFVIKKETESPVDKNNVEYWTTYNYKISGNLYLVYRLNTLDSYEVSTEFFKGPINDVGIYDPDLNSKQVLDGNVGIKFDVTYHYNSPDGYYDNTILYGKKGDFDPGKVIKGLILNKANLLEFTPSKPSYDYIDNLYTYKESYWKTIAYSKENYTLTFVPLTIYGEITNLEKEITVKLSLINSGEISLDQWKYFVEDTGVTITYGILSYPFTGTKVAELTLEFYNLTDPNKDENGRYIPNYSYIMDERSSYHGIFQKFISFDSIDKRAAYLVKFTYKTKNSSGVLSDNPITIGYKTMITTSLYNDLYTSVNINDFNNLGNNLRNEFTLKTTLSLEFIEDTSITLEGELNLSNTDGWITNSKEVNVKNIIHSYIDESQLNLYPFDIKDFKATYQLKSSSSPNIENMRLIGKEESKDTLFVNDKIGNNISETLTTDGILTTSGILYSKYYGVPASKNIVFNNVITLYFPNIESNAEYALNRNNTLFGFSKLSEFNCLTCGVGYVGVGNILKGGRDNHGVKFILIIGSNGQIQVKNDIHRTIYGNADGDFYDYKDGLTTFYLETLLRNNNFKKMFENQEFVWIRGNDNQDPGNNWTKDTINDFVTYTRDGKTIDKIKKLIKKDLLFWKHSDYGYLLVQSYNSNSYLPIEAKELSELLSNIYVNIGEQYENNYQIPSTDNYRYNSDYSVNITDTILITPSYNAYIIDDDSNRDYNTIVSSNLTAIVDNLEQSESLEKYVKFTFKKDPLTVDFNHSVNMEGADNILDKIIRLLSGASDITILLDSNNNVYFSDFEGNSLSNTKAYEVVAEGGKSKIYLFGKKDDKNKKLSNNIKLRNGKIVPYNISIKNDGVILKDGSRDLETALNYGLRMNCVNLKT